MLTHAIDNPAPSTVILITGDRDFAYAMSILRLRRYLVTLITLPNAHASLKVQASVCFNWNNHVLGPTDISTREFNKPGSLSFQERPSGWDSVVLGSPHSHRTESMDRNERVDRAQTIRTAAQKRSTSHLAFDDPLKYPDLERNERKSTTFVDAGPLGMQNGTPPTVPSHTLPSTHTPRAGHGTNSLPLARSGAGSSMVIPHSRTLSTFTPQAGSSSAHITQNFEESYKLADTATLAHMSSLDNKSDCRVKPTILSEDEGQIPRPLNLSRKNEPSTFIPAVEVLRSSASKPYPNQHIWDPSLSFRPASAPSSLPVSFPPFIAATPTTPTPVITGPKTFVSFPHPSVPQSAASNSSQGSTNNGLTGSVIQAKPAIVTPVNFKVLVQSLQSHRLKGNYRPPRSIVSIEIAKNGLTYKKAGVEKFGQYVALAEQLGIVELGGREGGAWISLKPDWYDAS
ncbi:hypothetical protein GALMADRAFT_227907 [Galerina marginata CBS 339.88]|uniref:Uncharacterized protein n=1 Tax=Galerina marginata (strain CBS 339.88) TaxID=685588 RepID=A0A067T0N8_GALM3|nr:hypothetical protein GALMADRAFT_227907 [Galerina marginata CBS 339.88]